MLAGRSYLIVGPFGVSRIIRQSVKTLIAPDNKLGCEVDGSGPELGRQSERQRLFGKEQAESDEQKLESWICGISSVGSANRPLLICRTG